MRIAVVSTVLMALLGCQSTEGTQKAAVGESTNNQEVEIQNVVSEAPAGTANFLASLTDEDYYPILKPGNWLGIDTGAVYQVFIGSDEEPSIVIAYAADTEDSYYFLNFADEKKIDIQEATSNAFKNLHALGLELYHPDGYDEKVVVAMPDSFASEALLSSVQMNKIHETLGTDEFIVSVATRTTLAAITLDAPDEYFKRFVREHIDIWNEEDNARISPDLFVVRNGKVATLIPLSK